MNQVPTELKVIQHNVLYWTDNTKNELANYYNRENADVILMNATSINDDNRIKLFNYNVHQKNYK